MRKPFLETPPVFNLNPNNGIETETFKFELITPMCGGDSKSWELNTVAPVRAQSVKGQLRFWWRTMQNEGDSKKLLEMENRIWGGDIEDEMDATGKKKKSIKSHVKIEISEQNVVDRKSVQLVKDENKPKDKGKLKDTTIPLYLVFPVEHALKSDEKPEVFYITDLTFLLKISFSYDLKEEIYNVLKLWTLFGGVGARTRRGCGSLYCEELLKEFSDEKAIKTFIERISLSGEITPYARLAGAQVAIGNENNSACETWKKLIGNYKGFRQDRLLPTGGDQRPGRSFWPEPDAIRSMTTHAPLHQPEHPDGIWFPRAAFGLPIITKFNTSGNGAGDPNGQFQLLPAAEGCERWPSPVVIKVIKLANQKVLPVALVFKQTFPENLKLQKTKENTTGKNKTENVLPCPLPHSACPFSSEGKFMKTNNHLQEGETVYHALFSALGLKEIK